MSSTTTSANKTKSIAAVIAIPKFSSPGLEANLKITSGKVAPDPVAKKLAAPNSPSDASETNAAAAARGLAKIGPSMLPNTLNFVAPSIWAASRISRLIPSRAGLMIW
jgi:hypothetical protein